MTTRTLILLTAERLFATQGIDATSLRQISVAAEQRNVGAAQYHFGDRESLIKAIFRHRLDVIDVRRRELLKPLGADSDTRSVVEALIRPLAEQAVRPDSHYVRFLDRLFEHLGRRAHALPEAGGLEEAVAAGRLLADRMSHLPAAHARLRVRWVSELILSGLADLEQRHQDGEAGDPEEFTAAVIDAATGLLTAPSSTHPG
ncbi:TetR/AcrR family transcriptional regulator [Actinomadura sp. WAC 06369]|uniref:TetR/AcrR family transcriptional regulator n=1 Tax=Actinomadura sp. WAC 06369 TaxID=2203193 RepID=UPI000F7AB72B|nr:helix-turn-helix domain-containing protein [Actinomadura sp. WAC 06369]RSN46939.1 TetR/AcrR family transcriptional regulator [Actinomadura sp. WAC 06369]